MQTKSPNVTYRTGNIDPLWGEVVVLAAFSDWGEKGWMICHECDDPSRGGIRYYPKVWFPLDQREAAVARAGRFKE